MQTLFVINIISILACLVALKRVLVCILIAELKARLLEHCVEDEKNVE